MQTTSADFTAEAKDTVRSITADFRVSWKKQYSASYRAFAIGVSAIGGNDPIASTGGIISDWNRYFYFDESAYLTGLSYERGLKMPTGGLSMAMYEANLDNTSGRFTPRHMGGSSELYTSAYKVMRPTIISAGFNIGGVSNTAPQIVGLNQKPPKIDIRTKTVSTSGYDFISYLQNSYLDHQIMFTSQRSDQVISSVLNDLGFSTAQYDLDYGIQPIPFGLFDVGTRFSDVIDKLVEAENGQFYQAENGVLKFDNRQHWDSAPYNAVTKVLYTAQVLEAESPDDDHIINIVEVVGSQYQKQPVQAIFTLNSQNSIFIQAGTTVDKFFNSEDSILSITNPTGTGTVSYFVANSAQDGSGTDLTSSITFTNRGTFAKTVKYDITNSSGSDAYIIQLVIQGRVVKRVADIYYREQDDSSVTAYQERPFKINNEYIQNSDWAASYARMILNDFSEPENLQKIKIRAMPDLQLGDLVSWQGRYWRIYDIKTTINPAQGFVQELTLLQRTITTYFRIGISTIGGSDKVAP